MKRFLQVIVVLVLIVGAVMWWTQRMLDDEVAERQAVLIAGPPPPDHDITAMDNETARALLSRDARELREYENRLRQIKAQE